MKGVITVPVTKDMQVSNMEEYIEIAIETGAEDVILTKNENAEEGDPELVLKVCLTVIVKILKRKFHILFVPTGFTEGARLSSHSVRPKI